MELTHIFQDRESFNEAVDHIESMAPEQREEGYRVKLDLQQFLEPLQDIFVEINYRIRGMIFKGDEEGAVRDFLYDCTVGTQTAHQ